MEKSIPYISFGYDFIKIKINNISNDIIKNNEDLLLLSDNNFNYNLYLLQYNNLIYYLNHHEMRYIELPLSSEEVNLLINNNDIIYL